MTSVGCPSFTPAWLALPCGQLAQRTLHGIGAQVTAARPHPGHTPAQRSSRLANRTPRGAAILSEMPHQTHRRPDPAARRSLHSCGPRRPTGNDPSPSPVQCIHQRRAALHKHEPNRGPASQRLPPMARRGAEPVWLALLCSMFMQCKHHASRMGPCISSLAPWSPQPSCFLQRRRLASASY